MADETKDTTIWTLAQVRTHMDILDNEDGTPDTSKDAGLVSVADAISELVEEKTHQTLVARTFTDEHDGERYQGRERVYLYKAPIVSVASVKVRRFPTDPDDRIETVETRDYQIDKGTANRYGSIWFHSYAIPYGIANVTVTYDAGYGEKGSLNLPQALVFAGLEMLKITFNQADKNQAGFRTIDIGDNTLRLENSWPKQITDAMKAWRRVY